MTWRRAEEVSGYPLHDQPHLHAPLQLREYYLARLGPYVDLRTSRMDVTDFSPAGTGRRIPDRSRIRDASAFDSRDRDYLYRNPWNAFSVSDVQIARFPEYRRLREKIPPGGAPDDLFSTQELREIKFWFTSRSSTPIPPGAVRLPDGTVCDLSDYVTFRSDSTFVLKKKITEEDCVRMVVEAYKVMVNIIPVHRALSSHEGVSGAYHHPVHSSDTPSDI